MDAASATVPEQVQTKSAALLKQSVSLSPQELADAIQIDQVVAAAALQNLCAAGTAMYDSDIDAYRWRELFPPSIQVPTSDSNENKEWLAAKTLVNKGHTELVTNDVAEDGARITIISVGKGKYTAELELDEDGRMKRAQCTCGTFKKHQLRKF